MNDDDFIRELQAIFDANDPADGIDRHAGFGSEVRITGLRRVDDGDFPELEVRGSDDELPRFYKSEGPDGWFAGPAEP